jgi:hypothetical protein
VLNIKLKWRFTYDQEVSFNSTELNESGIARLLSAVPIVRMHAYNNVHVGCYLYSVNACTT